MKYDQIYKDNNVWGSRPNELLQMIYSQLDANSEFLDLGCGQGRDTIFMLQKGFRVTAVDKSQEGINRIKEYISANNLPSSNVILYCDDINIFSIEKGKYAVINCYNSIQFLPKKEALGLIGKIKDTLRDSGYIIISSFTIHDPLYNKFGNDKRCFFEEQELRQLFSSFKIDYYEEKEIEDKRHPGSPEPHMHGVVKMVAQKLSASDKA